MSVSLADERRAALPALRDDESIMDTLKGRPTYTENAGSRLTVRHLEQRDRALGAIERAQQEVARLVELEQGTSQTVTSPRIAKVREVGGELGKLRSLLDRTYV